MADEEQEPVVEVKKSKRLIWIVIAAAALVVVGAGGLLLMKYLRPPQASASDGVDGAAANEGGEGSVGRVKSTMTLDPFLVNLADQENTRFVKLTLRLGLDQPGIGERLAEDPVVVAATRDKIISILTTRTSEQILSSAGKDKLRAEIRDSLNPLLPKGKIVEVYIMDFVVQL
jgi:flagellar FliL protein